ncbi:MAG TPA: hypothetical protein VFE47_24665 [Tepidisphaeraceae bacterium]|jgi:hypothetical protein|nr:hypothetical protein [Tepidisphaeraceae bacterium]
MGADMFIQSIGFKAKDRYLIDQESAKSVFAKASEAIEAIDEARMAQINQEHGTEYSDLHYYKRDLRNALAEVEAAALGTHRQAAIAEGGGGIILLLSGGLSTGDAPTELYESMSRLAEAEVLPDARWPNGL